ncbi:hypothetical protein SAMN05216341_1198 [Leuconostocaceae bacterium R-53105]|uniref:Uncharacterized protein n=1 Tax=Convivina intestini TaxID=1505726 RepID=A0A2U1D570_9LACO|nr:hypothetical protein C7384_11028 [Convivina intestini]CAH1856837.1 hypothetical protein R077811_01350 [Convivina intestini]SDC19544.1 hypothetical protein SAMN05216341_1198 [Leuconostocaceae bacterium R-53105]
MQKIKNYYPHVGITLTVFMLIYFVSIILNDLQVILLPHWLRDNFLFGLIFYTLAISSLNKKK